MNARQEWTVSCRDQQGKKRHLTVVAEPGNIVVLTPPGENTYLSQLEVGRLRAALRDALVASSQTPTGNGLS